jgi:hypothetical protein
VLASAAASWDRISERLASPVSESCVAWYSNCLRLARNSVMSAKEDTADERGSPGLSRRLLPDNQRR